MRVLLLSDPSNPHTIKWVNSLKNKGIEVYLFGLSKYDPSQYHSDVSIYSFNTPEFIETKFNGSLLKIYYLMSIPILLNLIRKIKPDIVHAHYASSYGLLGAFGRIHPFIISVWGTDVYIFPKLSSLHKNILKYSLSRADLITSTSFKMAEETKKYTDKFIKVIPFGIVTDRMKKSTSRSIFQGKNIVIGTIKNLEHKYGHKYLFQAFAILLKKYPDVNLKLLIIGSGSMKNELDHYSKELSINDNIVFTGAIPHSLISEYHNMMDIEVYLSDYESFGVSVVEASACEKPVVVSDVGGLPEVVISGQTGFVVPAGDIYSAVEALEILILDEELRVQFGKAGRKKIMELYNWNDNLNEMIKLYENTVKKN